MYVSLFRRGRRVRPGASLLVPALIAPLLALSPAHAQQVASTNAIQPSGSITPILGSTTAGVTAPVVIPSVDSGAVSTLVVRGTPAMGQNNLVRLWICGDGSGATVRVRGIVGESSATMADDITKKPVWISPYIPIDFTGWKEMVIPASKFSLRIPDAARFQIDSNLPADAQTSIIPASPGYKWSDIDAIAIETTAKRHATIEIDDIAWAQADNSGAVVATTPVDSFEGGNVAAWQPSGTPVQQQSLTYGITTASGSVHGGRVAFKLDVMSPAAFRQLTLQPAVKKVLAAIHSPFLVFTPQSLFEPIYAWSLPQRGSTSSDLQITACPDETTAASFCVYSQKLLSNITVDVQDDLLAVGHTITKDAVNVDVVKVWNEDGAGEMHDPDTAGPAPELLLKDDRVALSGVAPEVRLDGPVNTDIPADSTKQFWVTVTVPHNAMPGQYSGNIVLTTQSGTVVPVHLALTVLPLRLLTPAKQYGINLRSRLDTPPATLPSSDGTQLVTDFVSPDILQKQLADITAHGVKIVSMYDAPATMWQAMDIYKTAGVTAPYVYKGVDTDLAALANGAKQNGANTLVVYSGDAGQMAQCQKTGLETMDYIDSQANFDALQANLDIPVYNRDCPYCQRLVQTDGQRLSMKRDWWFWPATDDDPLNNRLSAGLLLSRANLYGAYLPDYQTCFGSDPYDQTSAGAPDGLNAYRPLMLTYPAKDGVIDTLQWEAVREGINDVRFLTTFYSALRECKDAHIAKDLVTKSEAYVRTTLNGPLALMTGAQYDAARAQITAYALQLRTTVDAYNAKSALQ